MRITAIHETAAPIKSTIANAYIDFSKMTCSLVAVVTDVIQDGKPVTGFGFSSNGRYAAGAIMRDRMIPRLLDAPPETLLDPQTGRLDPFRAWDTMMTNEKPGGHGERSVAVGTLDMAIWDALAKIAGVPLWRLLADRYQNGNADPDVWVYAAGGYYQPDKGIAGLVDEVKSYQGMGYADFKLKIGGAPLAQDLKRIEAVIEVAGSAAHVAVDANGRFDRETAIAYAKALEPLGLLWYEEAGDPLDYALQAALADHYAPPMATGENLFSTIDATNLIRHAGLRPDRDWLQFDCALSYGLCEYTRTLDMLEAHGWSIRRVVPHGGHQMSLNIAAGLHLGGNESYPGIFQPFGGFADGIKVENGRVKLPETPGIGIETKAGLYALCKALAAG